MSTPDAGIRIDTITTRGGDGGQTSLGDGTRVSKADPLIAAMGDVDEANAALGIVRAVLAAGHPQAAVLLRLQSALFDLGADLCIPDATRPSRLGQGSVDYLDEQVEALRALQPPLRSFVLPGGSPAAAHAHMARTIARRAERSLVASGRWPEGGAALRFCNRLSDYLFVLARHLNEDGAGDVVWTPSPTA